MDERKLRCAVIKEELVALTGDHVAALALSQFLYWSERTRDFDRFIAEEKKRDPNVNVRPAHGWIYKTMGELLEELMLTVSASTLRRRVQHLVAEKWLMERRNPHHKWDHTLQYRPDIQTIQKDLHALGYNLAGYPLQFSKGFFHGEETNPHPEDTSPQGENSDLHDDDTIPETTTETIPESTTDNPEKTGDDLLDQFFGARPESVPLDCKGNAAIPVQAGGGHSPAHKLVDGICRYNGLTQGAESLPEKKRISWISHIAEIIEQWGGATVEQAHLAWQAWIVDYAWKGKVNPFYSSFETEIGPLLVGVREGSITLETLKAKAQEANGGGTHAGNKRRGKGGSRKGQWSPEEIAAANQKAADEADEADELGEAA